MEKSKLRSFVLFIAVTLCAVGNVLAQAATDASKITGTVKDPNQGIIVDAQATLVNVQTNMKVTSATNGQGAYSFSALPAGAYVVEIDAKGFKQGKSPDIWIAAGHTVNFDFALQLEGNTESVNVSAGTFENTYRVDTLQPATPFGLTPIVNLPYTVNVISRQLIDDTMARSFKQVAKYLPLVSFQEMQGPEILRPETRGMQGTNMQGDRMDGMGFAVTTPAALEEFEQVEVLSGVGGSMYGPSNPSGIFNFVTKTPTEEPLQEAEVEYEGRSIVTGHLDLGGRVGPEKMFGYRTNVVLGDGTGYVTDSQLRRQLGAIALDVRPFAHTTIGGNFSYYELFQHGYPGWFSYNPTLNPTAKASAQCESANPGTASCYSAKVYSTLPVQAPDPVRQGYGQRILGPDMNNEIGEVQVKQDFSPNWRLIASVLHQIANRNVNTAVNAFYDTNGNYQMFEENEFQSTLATRFQVKSDLGYVTGKFKTGNIGHEVVMGSTGYRFASWNPIVGPTAYYLCTATAAGKQQPYAGTCSANINNPLVFSNPSVTHFEGSGATQGLYVTSVIHQQGINFGDTISLNRRWLLRVAASEDWTWTTSYASPGGPAHETPGYMVQAPSTTGSVLYKVAPNQTAYVTFADSIQAPDTAPGTSGNTIVANSSQALPPYRSTEWEAGYKLESRRMNFSADFFRLRRPFADVVETSTTVGYNCGGTVLKSGQICENDQIIGQQINHGVEAMLSGKVTQSLRVVAGVTALTPILTDTFVLLPAGNPNVSSTCVDPKGVAASALICPSYVTNNKNLVGIPDYKSNVLAEYQIPAVTGAFFTFDWQHVGRRAVDDRNSYWVPQYNTFDLGGRYSAKVFGKVTTWLLTINNVTNVHYWSTLGPGSITGQSSADLAHLGEPRLMTASMRYNF
jgi:iron complex outermembrane receptor protein